MTGAGTSATQDPSPRFGVPWYDSRSHADRDGPTQRSAVGRARDGCSAASLPVEAVPHGRPAVPLVGAADRARAARLLWRPRELVRRRAAAPHRHQEPAPRLLCDRRRVAGGGLLGARPARGVPGPRGRGHARDRIRRGSPRRAAAPGRARPPRLTRLPHLGDLGDERRAPRGLLGVGRLLLDPGRRGAPYGFALRRGRARRRGGAHEVLRGGLDPAARALRALARAPTRPLVPGARGSRGRIGGLPVGDGRALRAGPPHRCRRVRQREPHRAGLGSPPPDHAGPLVHRRLRRPPPLPPARPRALALARGRCGCGCARVRTLGGAPRARRAARHPQRRRRLRALAPARGLREAAQRRRAPAARLGGRDLRVRDLAELDRERTLDPPAAAGARDRDLAAPRRARRRAQGVARAPRSRRRARLRGGERGPAQRGEREASGGPPRREVRREPGGALVPGALGLPVLHGGAWLPSARSEALAAPGGRARGAPAQEQRGLSAALAAGAPGGARGRAAGLRGGDGPPRRGGLLHQSLGTAALRVRRRPGRPLRRLRGHTVDRLRPAPPASNGFRSRQRRPSKLSTITSSPSRPFT